VSTDHISGDRGEVAPADASPATGMSSRRKWLATLSLGLSSLAALAIATPIAGLILAPLWKRAPRIWRAVGSVDDFAIGSTVEVAFADSSPLPWAGVTARTAAWLRRVDETTFLAFAANCTHLGCPVRWLPDAKLFMCPCHGGVYDAAGRVTAGPPPRPLAKYDVRVRDGQVEIRTMPLPTA
jgi:menaquinol-cytochrome c reductase iron-sulfur subunit